MLQALSPRPLQLKGPAERADKGSPVTALEVSDGRPHGRALACAACERRITSEGARIAVAGRHAHTFANPFGFAYHIGCFSTAVGLARVGPPSGEYAWFARHTWQIEQCAGCGEHLGWLFQGQGAFFHGLILDRLIAVDERSS
jgi:hypothetical protein